MENPLPSMESKNAGDSQYLQVAGLADSIEHSHEVFSVGLANSETLGFVPAPIEPNSGCVWVDTNSGYNAQGISIIAFCSLKYRVSGLNALQTE
jgi:hypothetical protein